MVLWRVGVLRVLRVVCMDSKEAFEFLGSDTFSGHQNAGLLLNRET